jgi:glycosyltransferase involved in cell wall biosynthesis
MSIVIFGDTFSYPEGEAATNRVHTYAKGFYENGINVHIICFDSEYNSSGDGISEGIYFYHPFGQLKRSKYFLVRRWQKFLKYFKTISIIRRISNNDRIITCICYTQLFTTMLFGVALARFTRTKIILERSEHPLRNYQGSFFRKLHGKIKSDLETALCDGVFCISQYLIDFYKNRGVNPEKLFLVPSTVDAERFQTAYSSPLSFQYILYCGSLNTSKDGVDILIESFVKIAEEFPEINLVIIGKGDTDQELLFFKKFVAQLNISNRVFFLGYLTRTEIPAYLVNAKILALARPKSIVADAGFPSKVTEYLTTGVPVVLTEVGEIPVYLRDNENAFISEPDNIDAFAGKLEFVLSHYDYAKEVAKSGKDLTDTIFNYKYQSRRIIGFINTN